VTKHSRRDFLARSGGAMAAMSALQALAPGAYAQENNTIKVALVGCGGRGGGAAVNALSTKGPTQLVALADVFENRLKGTLGHLSKNHKDKVDVPPERCFVGFDAYRKAIDAVAPGGVVILATPPGFRPFHFEYAVEKGVNVFMEKSFGVDAPGIRRVLKAGQEAAKKNLKVVGGLNQRYSFSNQEAIKQLQGGIIGELVTGYAYRMHGPVGFAPKGKDESDLSHQIRNYSNFTWLNGSFILDWLIHNLDVICWAKNAWPASAQGHGGRQQRTEPDMLFDHYIVEYTFPDGTRMIAQGRHQNGTWGFFADVIHGATGCATLGEGVGQARICKGHHLKRENAVWEYKGGNNSYQTEHDVLFEAIRENKPQNDTERCAYAAMTGILGRMAAESGQVVTWEQALASELVQGPGVENLKSLDDPPPVKPNAEGRYPIAMPGVTKAL